MKSNILVDAFKSSLAGLKTAKKGKWDLYFTIGAVLITVAILGYLVFSQWHTLISYPWRLRPEYLGLTFAIYTVILALTVFVWARMMESLGKKIAFTKHFRSFTISALGKRLPGTLWYVLWRAQVYGEDSSIKLVSVASAIEMAVTIIAAVFTCLIFSISLITQYQWSLIGIGVLLAISVVVIHPRFVAYVLKRMKVEVNDLRYTDLIWWIGLYILIWIMIGAMLFTIGNFFTPIALVQLGYFIGCVALVGVLSRLLLFSPSLFGFGEVSFSLLLSSIVPSSIAVVIAVSYRLIVISFEIIWAVISILIEKALIKPG